jgi:hypothetical protein
MDEIFAWAIKYWLDIMFSAFAAGVSYQMRQMMIRFKKREREDEALRESVKTLVRSHIFKSYSKAVEQGYCEIWRRDYAESMYEAYHVLNGNGTVTDIVRRMREMPTEEEQKHEQ